jgi:epoxyqueuosine reductase
MKKVNRAMINQPWAWRKVSAESVKSHALDLGFNLVGITRAEPSPHLNAYLRWLDRGMHGEMGYMARSDRVGRRRDLTTILPGVRSLVVVGLDYGALDVPPELLADPARGRIARYAWGLDYHDLMTPRLGILAERLTAEWATNMADDDPRGEAPSRIYVDTGAILERSHAHEAGLGFFGKNTMLIHPRRGSYFFLGEILTPLEFDRYDMPGRASMCGTCTRCQPACPTDAFPQPYVLDARRCISYLTIEHKGFIDRALRPLIGNWIMGCDVCQDVCPFTRFAPPTRERAFRPESVERIAPPLIELLELDDEGFRKLFEGSPVMRLKRDRLVRNACIAAGNWGDVRAAPHLIKLLRDRSALVRGHAAWALSRISSATAQSREALHAAAGTETDHEALDEMRLALSNLGDNQGVC